MDKKQYKELKSLAIEARKYKSAKEFVDKSQYEDYQSIHRAVREGKLKIGDITTSKAYGGEIVEIVSPKYDGEINELGLPIKYRIQSKSQLTNFYNQVVKGRQDNNLNNTNMSKKEDFEEYKEIDGNSHTEIEGIIMKVGNKYEGRVLINGVIAATSPKALDKSFAKAWLDKSLPPYREYYEKFSSNPHQKENPHSSLSERIHKEKAVFLYGDEQKGLALRYENDPFFIDFYLENNIVKISSFFNEEEARDYARSSWKEYRERASSTQEKKQIPLNPVTKDEVMEVKEWLDGIKKKHNIKGQIPDKVVLEELEKEKKERVFGWNRGEVIKKSEDEFIIRHEDTGEVIKKVSLLDSARAFFNGYEKGWNEKGKRNLSIKKAKYLLVKDEFGKILLKTDKSRPEIAESYISGYKIGGKREINFWLSSKRK